MFILHIMYIAQHTLVFGNQTYPITIRNHSNKKQQQQQKLVGIISAGCQSRSNSAQISWNFDFSCTPHIARRTGPNFGLNVIYVDTSCKICWCNSNHQQTHKRIHADNERSTHECATRGVCHIYNLIHNPRYIITLWSWNRPFVNLGWRPVYLCQLRTIICHEPFLVTGFLCYYSMRITVFFLSPVGWLFVATRARCSLHLFLAG